MVPPQFTAISHWQPFQVQAYLSSVTGTPVASYYGGIRFSALLTEGIREGRPLCLAPTGNSLQALSNLLVSAHRIYAVIIAPLFRRVKHFCKKYSFFCIFGQDFLFVCCGRVSLLCAYLLKKCKKIKKGIDKSEKECSNWWQIWISQRTTVMKRVGVWRLQRVVGWCETIADHPVWPIASESKDRTAKA